VSIVTDAELAERGMASAETVTTMGSGSMAGDRVGGGLWQRPSAARSRSTAQGVARLDLMPRCASKASNPRRTKAVED